MKRFITIGLFLLLSLMSMWGQEQMSIAERNPDCQI